MHGSVIDVTLVNPYKGIDFGTYPNELHYIRNVFGCPLKFGIYVNHTTDIGRIENVHFNRILGAMHFHGKARARAGRRLGLSGAEPCRLSHRPDGLGVHVGLFRDLRQGGPAFR